MVRLILRARATIFTAMIGALSATAAQAADMPFPVEAPPPVNEGPVEWGSNWYLRGDVGAAQLSPSTINGVVLANSFPNSWNVGLGGGYKFNNWFRGDVTVDYESLYHRNSYQYAMLPCQIGAVADPANPLNIFPVYSGCYPRVRNRTESMLVLANAYLDLGNWYGFTPYIGAGVGVNVLYQQSQMNWFMGNGVSYAGVTWSDPRNGATYMANWDQRRDGTYLRIAYAFMGGVAYDIDEHWKVDLGYRFVNMGKIDGFDRFNNLFSKNLTSQQVRIGFRYMID